MYPKSTKQFCIFSIIRTIICMIRLSLIQGKAMCLKFVVKTNSDTIKLLSQHVTQFCFNTTHRCKH